MAQAPRPGAVHWIDHFVVPVNNMLPWERFMETVFGGTVHHRNGLSTAEMLRGGQVRTFYNVGHHEIGGFLQPRLLPDSPGPGKILPRWGFYIRQDTIDLHRRRFDEYGVAYQDPIRTSEEGEEGVALRFEDVDGVYLVGGGTHPGSGLPVIYEGARITADLILQDLGLEAALPALR